MISVQLDGEEIRLDVEEWERWVADGRVPPDALVRAEGSSWVPARELEAYRRLVAPPPAASRPAPSLKDVLLPARGLSATEGLILTNLLVTGALVFLWRESYAADLRRAMDRWWSDVHETGAAWRWIPTIFLHAGVGHLARNLVSLLAGAGAVEFLMGRGWTLAAYVLTGLAGMALSYTGHGGPPLSVGASGAVFGLLGTTAAFLVRRRGLFSYRQRWKTRRVYLPLFVALYVPSLLNADYFAHVGGLAAGVFLGFFVPPHARVRALAEPDPPAD
jgi:membrane associated rhomboid family serine protease